MAEMITAAFDHITPPAAAQGIFADMTGQPDAVTRAAEALQTAGVTGLFGTVGGVAGWEGAGESAGSGVGSSIIGG